MTEIEREVLRRFLPDPFLDFLQTEWGSTKIWWSDSESRVLDTKSDPSWKTSTRVTFFEGRETEFNVYRYERLTLTSIWESVVRFHGPWDQRFQGLITLFGAEDVIYARRDKGTERCVHAPT